jgi:hypothetical protein
MGSRIRNPTKMPVIEVAAVTAVTAKERGSITDAKSKTISMSIHGL